MPSSPMFAAVDPFDEYELLDVPAAPAALMAVFDSVPDPRSARGIRHRLSVILAVAACAVVTGARSFAAVAEWVAATSPGLLARVGVSDGPPSESTIRRTLQQLHGDGLDRLLGAWAQLREPPSRGRRVIAIDGKSVRGSATPDRRCRHLLAALGHGSRMVLGQLDVAVKTNEIPLFATLLDSIDLLGVLVTADALHCQAEHARYLIEQRGAHYLFTVKGNQPKLRAQLAALPWTGVNIGATQHDRGHGRIEKRSIKVVTVKAGILFPHAAQAIQIIRRRRLINSKKWRSETVYAVTSLPAEQAQPTQLAGWLKGHWGIENSLHWVRDVTFSEDHSQTRTAAGPQVMATLRNLAINLLRLAGATNIAAALRHQARQPIRPLKLLLTS
ncbi:MAG: ISAs1 family transposase [Nakamurella sp.]